MWAPGDIDLNDLDPRYLPTPRPFTDYLYEVQRTTRVAKFINRFTKGLPAMGTRGEDKPHEGNKGQHKGTGREGRDRLANVEAMERIRQGNDSLNTANSNDTTQAD